MAITHRAPSNSGMACRTVRPPISSANRFASAGIMPNYAKPRDAATRVCEGSAPLADSGRGVTGLFSVCAASDGFAAGAGGQPGEDHRVGPDPERADRPVGHAHVYPAPV